MDNLKVITNNKPRELVALCDVPPEAAEDFDYIMGDDQFSPRLFKYKGAWYDINDSQAISTDNSRGKPRWTMVLPKDSPFAKYNGIFSESHWSGVVFRYADTNCETVVVARYYS